MNGHDDLVWLAEERPLPLELDDDSTGRARAALMTHVTAGRAPAAPRRRAHRARRPERRWLRPSRVLALAAVGTVVALAAGAALGGGDGKSPLSVGGVGVDVAAAAPLVKLADQVGQTAPLPGDATLIERHHVFADGKTMDGADLYSDNGTYYYAQTAKGLPDAIHAQESGTLDPRDNSDWVKRELAAALAVPKLAPAEAIKRMAKAALDPSVANAPPASLADQIDGIEDPAAKAQMRKKMEAAKKAVAAQAVKGIKPATPEELEQGNAWTNSMDALMAGGSRPDVRAGVLHLLALIPSVTVAKTTHDGRPALELVGHMFNDGYEEHLVIDAESGIPLRFVGTYPGQKPGVVMTYRVTRVTTADIAKG